jgi:hypothetical protein
VHRAHRLLSESTLILRTLKNRPGGKQTPSDFTRLRSIQSVTHFLRSEDFFAQSYAIPRNKLQMVIDEIPSVRDTVQSDGITRKNFFFN